MRSALAMVVLIVTYLLIKPGPGEEMGLGRLVIMVVVLLPFVFLGSGAKRGDLTADQKRRDQSAQALATQLISSPQHSAPAGRDSAAAGPSAARFEGESGVGKILFLRPFQVDEAVRVHNPRKSGAAALFVPMYSMILDSTVTLDDALRIHLRKLGELVAIGATGTPVGASRIRVGDSEWRDYFAVLAENAAAIIVYLGLRPGTQEEVAFIGRHPNLLSKTMLLLPARPLTDLEKPSDIPAILEYLGSIGISLSPDSQPGDGILLDPGGAERCRVPVIDGGWITPTVRRRKLQNLAAQAIAAGP